MCLVSWIYHIATRADWEQARRDGAYTTSTAGRTLEQEGFIHASYAAQVAGVANAFYRDSPDDLVLLVIARGRVHAEVRDEDVPGADLPFPHIYGPLNTDAVLAAHSLSPGPDGEFTVTPDHMRP